ncbi:MAG: MerR family transcriptional regulator [Bacteroidia bacterium]|nr:MerR family transcriptional regulator [Bacteroidia bacterium]
MSINLDYLFAEKDIEAFLINSAMITNFDLTRQFVMKDIGVTSRVFHHWSQKGLVNVRPKINDHNHVFSFVELIWFNIVNELRAYGFSLEKIKFVHDSLMQEISWNAFVNSLTISEKEKFIEEIDFLPSEYDDQKNNLKEILRKDMNDPDLSSDENDININALYLIIYNFLVIRSNVWIYIDIKGTVIPCVEKIMDKVKLNKLMDEYFFDRESYICISLMKFFRKFVQNPKYLDFVRDNDILNENEQYILSLIREGKAKAITIKFEGQKPSHIEITRERKLDVESRLSEVMLTKGYQDIVIKTKNGDIAYSNITTKKKLK